MKKSTLFILTLSVVALTLAPLCASAGHGTGPVAREGGKWRVGYMEGGPYVNYPQYLRAIVNGLVKLGWAESLSVPAFEDPLDSRKVWDWLSENIKSDTLEFAADGYWSAGWDKEKRRQNKSAAIARLNDKKDIDLMLAMGTWAGQDLANNEHTVPTMVASTSDAVRSKIIAAADDSGFDHVHARVDPTRYARQAKLFHEIIGFKTLGLVYEDSVEGRTYAAVEDVEKVAAEVGFKIVKCEAPFSGISDEEASAGVIKCHQELASKIDALYVTIHRGMLCKSMPDIIAPLLAKDIPTWSQAGSREVKQGILMSISRANFNEVGLFHATVMDKIFNGAKPRELGQVFEESNKIAINLETAQKIQYDPSFDILAAADEIFEEVSPLEDCK